MEQYGTIFMGKSNPSVAIFNSYVSFPEGINPADLNLEGFYAQDADEQCWNLIFE